MRFVLELFPTADGRVEGWVGRVGGDGQVFFSGWLELLRLLETNAASSRPPAAGS